MPYRSTENSTQAVWNENKAYRIPNDSQSTSEFKSTSLALLPQPVNRPVIRGGRIVYVMDRMTFVETDSQDQGPPQNPWRFSPPPGGFHIFR